jgi:glyoxylase-like metal-dependent hydrolase (beta-lactamase superfamily II)
MPAVSLDTAGAAELAELLHFLGDWLAADRDRLDASLRRFVGTAGYDTTGYDVAELRRDLDRFTFLIGGDDGEALFTPGHPR